MSYAPGAPLPSAGQILNAIDYMGRESWTKYIPTWTLAGLLAEPSELHRFHRHIACLCAHLWRRGVLERVMLEGDRGTRRPAWRRPEIIPF